MAAVAKDAICLTAPKPAALASGGTVYLPADGAASSPELRNVLTNARACAEHGAAARERGVFRRSPRPRRHSHTSLSSKHESYIL